MVVYTYLETSTGDVWAVSRNVDVPLATVQVTLPQVDSKRSDGAASYVGRATCGPVYVRWTGSVYEWLDNPDWSCPVGVLADGLYWKPDTLELGLGTDSPEEPIHVVRNSNDNRAILIEQVAVGNAAVARFIAKCDTAQVSLACYSSAYTTSGSKKANGSQLFTNKEGGLTLVAKHADGAVSIYAGGNADGDKQLSATAAGIQILNLLDMDDNLISGVADPVSDQDAATKSYVDAYTPANSANWDGDPATAIEAIDRIAAALAALDGPIA